MKFISKEFNALPEKAQKELLAKFTLELENEKKESKKIIMSKSKEIKKDYNFKNKYNLFKKIYSLPEILSRAESLAKLFQSKNSKKTKILNELIKKITSLKSFLSNEIHPFLKLGLQYSINDIEKKYKDEPWGEENKMRSIFFIEEKLSYFLDDCLSILQKTPRDKGGRPNFSLPKKAIYFLACIYAEGTGKFPEHTWNREEEKYEGDFLNFLLAVKPLLKLLKIDLKAETTIRTYASEVISENKNAIAQSANIPIED